MLDTLTGLDTRLFFILNGSVVNPAFDGLFFLLTKKPILTAIAAAVWAFAFFVGSGRTRWFLLLGVIAFAADDLIVYALKNAFARVRPCHFLGGVRLITECPESYSFPSRHASGLFSLSVTLVLGLKRYRVPLLAAAFMVAFSRVYSGVHYPGDVLAGAFLGSAVAFAVYFIDRRYQPGFFGRIKNFITHREV
ncbi:MAG: phosphatase PAP2 family protein [Deltaproteobacteria bacterium]|nr:phosphatase PAP2 family protein [Deltaproteobacteria bacterium]